MQQTSTMEVLSHSPFQSPMLQSRRVSIVDSNKFRMETYLSEAIPKTETEMQDEVLALREKHRNSLSKSHDSLRRGTLARIDCMRMPSVDSGLAALSLDEGVFKYSSIMNMLRLPNAHDSDEESSGSDEEEIEYSEDDNSTSSDLNSVLLASRVVFPHPIRKIIKPKVYEKSEIPVSTSIIIPKKKRKKEIKREGSSMFNNGELEPMEETLSNEPKKRRKSQPEFLINGKYAPPKVKCITCELGSLRRTIPVDMIRGIGDGDVHSAMGFDYKQVVYLVLLGIIEKAKEDAEIIPFISDPDIPMYDVCLDRNYLKDLRSDVDYELVIKDKRIEKVKDLTHEEREKIRNAFDIIDVDGSGEIAFDVSKLLSRANISGS
jgi:hypothetical protein